jgi:2-oxoglutarate dehydrogenase E1 component
MERFLQLSANQNIQVANPTTPAQYFHLLRRQALRKIKKPLIVLTPKSLLRSPANVSQIASFLEGSFSEVLDDPNPIKKANRLIFCSGKVFYELLESRKRDDVALIRIEQIYPLNLDKIKTIVEKYKGFSECIWVQEEPKNMGAWSFIAPYLQGVVPQLYYIGREENATTATGSNKKHKQEQALLLEQAFGKL